MTDAERAILTWLRDRGGKMRIPSSTTRLSLEADGLIRWVPSDPSADSFPGTALFAITEKGRKALASELLVCPCTGDVCQRAGCGPKCLDSDPSVA